jgi:diacylglycerol kinase
MLKSFRHAFEGISIAFKDHPHFRVHTAAGIMALLLAYLLKVTRFELLIIIFTINLVLITEMLNTSLEEITNLITVKWSRQAKIAKDVAAGMVLLTALSSVVVGLLVFGPYIVDLAN